MKTKKAVEIEPIIESVEKIEPTIESAEEKAEVVESAEKKAFRIHIENYKVSNPVKYEMKKEALEKQLNELK